MLIDKNEFTEIFSQWMKEVVKGSCIEQICIDGKTLRRSFDRGKRSSSLHMVNAWSTGTSLCLGQLESVNKRDEINTIPKLLDLLDPKGCIVSIDALGCQKKIAKKIISRGGDYLLQVKGNQHYLELRTRALFDSLPCIPKSTKDFTLEIFKTETDGHGRIETRKCTVIAEKLGKCLGVNVLNEWPSLHTFIRIESKRVNKVTGKKSQEEARHFISSRRDLSGEQALSHARKHWEIENKLHWSLDVTFREDDKRNRSGNSANNCAILRKMAFNLLHMDPSDKTLPLKQQRAAGDNAFLLELLLRHSIKGYKKHKKK